MTQVVIDQLRKFPLKKPFTFRSLSWQTGIEYPPALADEYEHYTFILKEVYLFKDRDGLNATLSWRDQGMAVVSSIRAPSRCPLKYTDIIFELDGVPLMLLKNDIELQNMLSSSGEVLRLLVFRHLYTEAHLADLINKYGRIDIKIQENLDLEWGLLENVEGRNELLHSGKY